ncbi:MAG TPA: M36 family metallopeptidase [Planctomycetota bacterium]|nr:M36 family metallopeptidase [Planctomycetota bacterium]
MSKFPTSQLRPTFILLATLVVSTLASAADDARADVRALRAVLPQVHVSVDERLGVARHIATTDGFLTGPAGVGRAVAKAAAPGADRAVRSFISAWPSLFGGDATILDSAAVIRDDVTAHSGLHTKVWQQTLHGIPVHHGVLVARTTRQDDLVAIGSGFVPQPDKVAALLREHTTPAHAAIEALGALLSQAGASAEDLVVITDAAGVTQTQTLHAAGAVGDVTAQLVWFPRTASDVRLAWSFLLIERATNVGWTTVVDAQSLETLARIRLTSPGVVNPARLAAIAADAPVPPPRIAKTISPVTSASAASSIALRIFTSDSPAPLSPGHTNPADTSQPPVVARTLVTLTSLDATASPNGWIDGNQETRGSNVDAHLDLDHNNSADLPRPKGVGSSPVTFDFPLDLTQDPSTYRNAAVTNLFYWCNVAHDRFYQLGFTPSAGNFQGNDAVQADAQDGSDVNNANFTTPPDGTAPRMQMYVFTMTTPSRDSSLDASVILHEYTHGLTSRLVGGGVSGNLDALQCTGMGEGWSDFYALCLLTEAGDDPLGTYTTGSYLTGNYFRGIRNYPYVVEPAAIVSLSSLNPQTFRDIITNTEVHDMGEIWCQTLWECRGELIAKLGTVAGNTLMLQLVTDGLKLTPATPTFTEARDAILQADLVAHGGANLNELWRGFAKRGLGFGAVAGTSDDIVLVAESFEFSTHLRVSNVTGLNAGGPMGGPFDNSSASFVLSVPAGSSGVAWTATAGLSTPWVTITPASGSLAAGQTTTVTATLNATAVTLGNNTWRDTLLIADNTHQVMVTRPLTLRVAPNYLITSATFSWITPASPIPVSVGDDDFDSSLVLPFSIPFYGINRSALTIGSNGLIGFGASTDINSQENSALPSSITPNELLAVWWDDLDPSTAGSVTIGIEGTAPNRLAVVSWNGVPHYFSDHRTTNLFTFQVKMEEATGDLVCQYQEVRPTDATFGRGRKATIGVENGAGDLARQYSFLGSTLLSNNQALRYHFIAGTNAPANAAPTVATPAHATPTTVAGTFATMSVLGADDNGEANLSYTWSLAGKPTSVFTVQNNGRHSAGSTTIDFTQAGAYPIRATITDAGGKFVTSDVTVNVAQTLTTLTISPATVSVPNGGTLDFTARGTDQFGNAFSTEPTVTWSVTSGPGSINAAGLYTATAQAPVTIRAQSGSVIAFATITVTNGVPTVATVADTTSDPVTGSTTGVTVLGADDGGEPALTYTWSTTGTAPAAVTFSPNGTHAAKSSTATFSKAGSYTLRATISDALAASITSDVTVTVAQTATGLAIDPPTVTLVAGATQTFTGRDGDQFGNPISSSTRTVTWTTSGGTITNAGLFTAPSSSGTVTITGAATVGGQSATSTVTVTSSGGSGGGGGGGGGGKGGCGFGAAAAAFAALMALTWRRRRLND